MPGFTLAIWSQDIRKFHEPEVGGGRESSMVFTKEALPIFTYSYSRWIQQVISLKHLTLQPWTEESPQENKGRKLFCILEKSNKKLIKTADLIKFLLEPGHTVFHVAGLITFWFRGPNVLMAYNDLSLYIHYFWAELLFLCLSALVSQGSFILLPEIW